MNEFPFTLSLGLFETRLFDASSGSFAMSNWTASQSIVLLSYRRSCCFLCVIGVSTQLPVN